MLPSIVTVTFKKTLSDGNYGNETVEVTLTAELEEGETLDEVSRHLLVNARAEVHAELKISPSSVIRSAAEPRLAQLARPISPNDEVPADIPF